MERARQTLLRATKADSDGKVDEAILFYTEGVALMGPLIEQGHTELEGNYRAYILRLDELSRSRYPQQPTVSTMDDFARIDSLSEAFVRELGRGQPQSRPPSQAVNTVPLEPSTDDRLEKLKEFQNDLESGAVERGATRDILSERLASLRGYQDKVPKGEGRKERV